MMQKMIPHIFLTFMAGALANCKIKIIKNLLIRTFVAFYKPNLEEAMNKDINGYSSYNDFFTRKLAKESRIIELSQNSFIKCLVDWRHEDCYVSGSRKITHLDFKRVTIGILFFF